MFLSKNIFAARKKGQFNSATMWLSVPVYVGALLGACCRSHRRMTNNCAPNVTVLIVTILRVTFQSLKECIFTTAQKFPFFIGAENKNMTNASKIILSIVLTASAIATTSIAAYYVHPTLACTVAPIDTDHYVQDLRVRGIW
jgi:hypothetical protein